MAKAIIAAIATVIAGLIGGAIGSANHVSDLGVICAVAVMGGFIIYFREKKNQNDPK
ncbi:MAG: binding-protein-dependent transport permease [Clostridia bacterium]|nr:binding-protein-dependent transport permease [Clostridia bacterium]